MTVLETHLKKVRDRMQRAAQRVGRSVDEITLIAVTKYVSVEEALELRSLGVDHFGENRLPQALEKLKVLKPAKVDFIGHLQTNKVNKVVGMFESIHSLDRLSLIEAVEKRSASLGISQKGFIQVNVSGEESKGGFVASELPEVFDCLSHCPHFNIQGLMTMAPQQAEEKKLRLLFRTLKNLANEYDLEGLSMGMSQDFEIAIEEGATHIRVGSLLFGR